MRCIHSSHIQSNIHRFKYPHHSTKLLNSKAQMTDVIHARMVSRWFPPSLPAAWDFTLYFEQYPIILIREMCCKAISSSNKWPTAQQKPEESHPCRQGLCHEKPLILNPLTCHTHWKGPLREEAVFSGWERERGTEKKGLHGGVRGKLGGEGGTGVTPAPLSQKRGRWGEGSGSHPCFWLVPCEARCFLSLPTEGLCFTRKQQQWPQHARPSAASKLAWVRKEGRGFELEGGIRV